MAEDASDNKEVQNMCDFYEVPIYFIKIRIPWACNEKNSRHRLPCWMQDLQKELKQIEDEGRQLHRGGSAYDENSGT